MKLDQDASGMIEAIGLGTVVGIFAGAFFGVAVAHLLGGLFSEMGLIVIVHSSLAMATMGAWVTPSLMSKEEPEG